MIKEQKLPSDIIDEISRLASDKMDDIGYQIDGIVRDALDSFEYDLRDQSFEFDTGEEEFTRPERNEATTNLEECIEKNEVYLIEAANLKKLVYIMYCLNLPYRLHPDLRDDFATHIGKLLEDRIPLSDEEIGLLSGKKFVRGRVYQLDTIDPQLARVNGAKVVYLNTNEYGKHIVRLEGQQNIDFTVNTHELVEV